MKLLVGRHLSDVELAALQSIVGDGEVHVLQDREAVLARIAEAEVYVPGPWSESVFAAAKRLKWIHFLWVGLDRRLFPAVVESSVTVTNSAGVFAAPMAEHALALILAFSRGINLCARRPSAWRDTRAAVGHQLRELDGATLGVLGYGGIGQATAHRAGALGMRVLAIRSRAQESDGVAETIWGPDRLNDLLAEADYLLVSCPLTPETRGLIGPGELARMKPEAVIINLARGAIIDQPALIKALQEGQIGGAALDVATEEPLPPDSPLWQMENVIITPHIAAHSPGTWRRQFQLLQENLRRYVSGEALLHIVDKQAGY